MGKVFNSLYGSRESKKAATVSNPDNDDKIIAALRMRSKEGKEMLGISRMDYDKMPPGWMIRLGHNSKRRTAMYTRKINDRDYKNNKQSSLAAAKRIRDQVLERIFEKRDVTLTGVNSVYRYEHGWKVIWRTGSSTGKTHGKSFRDDEHGEDSFKSFQAAVRHRVSKEMKRYGHTSIDLERMDELYLMGLKRVYKRKDC